MPGLPLASQLLSCLSAAWPRANGHTDQFSAAGLEADGTGPQLGELFPSQGLVSRGAWVHQAEVQTWSGPRAPCLGPFTGQHMS